MVAYCYYGNCGGYGEEGELFRQDSQWMAANMELSILGGDEWARRLWAQILVNNPVGKWLWWGTILNWHTHYAVGTCENPEVGEPHLATEENAALFAGFLADHPEHGDGESCFFHVRHDGLVKTKWHTMGCEVWTQQYGIEGSAATMEEARLHVIHWSQWDWALNISDQCTVDWASWKSRRMMSQFGYGGAGFDNLGSPMQDGFFLPYEMEPVDIMEIPDEQEQTLEGLNGWYDENLSVFLNDVGISIRSVVPDAALVFNGGNYTGDRIVSFAGQFADWGERLLEWPFIAPHVGPGRIRHIIELSDALAAKGSYFAAETHYRTMDGVPDAEQAMWFLASLYVVKNEDNVFVMTGSCPEEEPCCSVESRLWFPIFGRDVGQPISDPIELDYGIFYREYEKDGTLYVMVIRADDIYGPTPPEYAAFDLPGEWYGVNADNEEMPVAWPLMLRSGDGYILVQQCERNT